MPETLTLIYARELDGILAGLRLLHGIMVAGRLTEAHIATVVALATAHGPPLQPAEIDHLCHRLTPLVSSETAPRSLRTDHAPETKERTHA